MPPHEIDGSRPSLLRALRHRNYRLFFAGQSVSLVGTWITRVATSWLVYRLTGSELLLGVVGFFGQIPTLLLAPFAGVLVDRSSRHRILVITQALSMIQSCALAALALSGVVRVWHVVMLQIAQGLINAFDTPARQTFVVEMVEGRDDLPNAIALNSAMVNGSRVIGPSIGGAIIAVVGEGWCFAIDGVSYLFVIGSLLMIQLAARPVGQIPGLRLADELRSGYRYVRASVPIRSALALLAVVSTMSVPYTVLMPAYVSEVLHAGPGALGWLMTATGIGALGGTIYLAARPSVVGLGRVIAVATFVLGAGLLAFSFSRSLWLSMLFLPIVGAGFMVQMAATNTVLQTIVDDAFRGRVMAFYTMAFVGTAPIGSLLAGLLAARIGGPATIAAGGAVCIIAGLWFVRILPAVRPLVRSIYIARGILPQVAVDTGQKTL
jgi:MFS family permease